MMSSVLTMTCTREFRRKILRNSLKNGQCIFSHTSLSKPMKHEFPKKIGSHFIHDDFSASAGWISISFSQKPFKYIKLGIKGSRSHFCVLGGPHEAVPICFCFCGGHVTYKGYHGRTKKREGNSSSSKVA